MDYLLRPRLSYYYRILVTNEMVCTCVYVITLLRRFFGLTRSTVKLSGTDAVFGGRFSQDTARFPGMF